MIDRLDSALLALAGTRERLRLPFREDKGVCAEQPELGRVVQAVYARQPSLETSVPALSFFWNPRDAWPRRPPSRCGEVRAGWP